MRAAAYHEAGHAITAHQLYNSLGFLEVAGDGSGGYLHHEFGLDLDSPKAMVWLAAMRAAGPIAEARHRGGPADPSEGDDEAVRTFAAVYHEGAEARFEAVAARLARRVLARRWADVERVALALAERGHLGPMELAELIGPRRPIR